MSTIIEVAKRAGVSIATVSNVIRRTKPVSPPLQKRVRAAIRELDYSPNAIARGLKVRQTHMLGIILPDITNPFFPGVIRGAEDTAFERGYFLVTANTDDQIGRERRLVSALRSYRVDGILLIPVPNPDVSHIKRAINSGVHVVCLDRPVSGIRADTVLLDNVRGARECVRHLIHIGHRRIAVISGPQKALNAQERLQGYKEALQEAGIPIDPSLILEGDFHFDSGSRLVKQLLQSHAQVTAILVCNGVMSLGALAAFEKCGIRCPEDIALATFDDVAFDHSMHPHLTTVVQPCYEIGARAASLLINRIEGKITGDPAVVRIVPSLAIRESTPPRNPGS